MAINFPRPPKHNASPSEWEQWFETAWNFINGSVVVSGDEDATIGSGETYHGVTLLTSGRTLTLPPANNLKDGESLVIQDESGSAGTSNITVARAGSDTINGATSVTISSNYGRLVLIKRGDGKWYSE